jgi:hypothetical protein
MGFNPRLAPYSVTLFGFESDPAADKNFAWFKFPERGMVTGGFACNDANITGTTNMVGAYLYKYATDGTTLQGTIGSVAEGASWAADVPRPWVITSFGSTAHFAQNEVVALVYDETTTALFNDSTFQLDYVLGYFA